MCGWVYDVYVSLGQCMCMYMWICFLWGLLRCSLLQGHITKTVHFRTKESSLNWVSRWWQAPSRAHLKCQTINQTLFPVATAHWVIQFSFYDTRKHSIQDGGKGWGKNKRGYWWWNIGSVCTHTHTYARMCAVPQKPENLKRNMLGKEDHFIRSHLQEVLTLRNKTLSAASHRFWGIMATTTLNIPVSYNLF